MTHEEILMMMDELDYEIEKLKKERQKLEEQHLEICKENAQKHVGRCFKVSGEIYVKVIGVPEEEVGDHMHLHFDEYQFPAIYLADDMNGLPFVCDTIHSEAWEGNGVGLFNTYEEVSQDEFNAEFKRRIDNFRSYILTKGNKTCLTCRMYNNPSDILCTSCTNEYSNYEPVEDDEN